MSLSSDTPVRRWFGIEILSHEKGAVDMERAANGLPLLFNHDSDQPIGRLEDLGVRDDGKFGGWMRFSRSARAQEVRQDVLDGILTDTSIGYQINKWEIERNADTEEETHTAVRWTPMEGSIVPVPADPTVGTNRSVEGPAHPAVETEARNAPQGNEEQEMAEKETTAAPEAGARAEGGDTLEGQREMIALAGETLGMDKLALRAIRDGKTLSEFRDMVEEKRIAEAQEATPAGSVDLTEKEEREYNPGRAIMAIANKRWEEGGSLEREASDEIAKRLGRETGGLFMPLNIRASVTGNIAGTNSLGGHAVPTIQLSLIEILRAKMVAARAGVKFLPGLTGDIKFPRQITANTPAWTTENPTAAGALTELTFDTVTLTPKSLYAATAYSRQALVQVSPDVQNIVYDDITTEVAKIIDSAIFNGTGSNGQPTGVRATSSIGNRTLGAAGDALDWDDLVGFETDLANANADAGSLGFVTNTKVRGKLKTTLKNTVNGANYLWGGGNDPGEINGYNAYVSNLIPSNLTQGTSTTICSSIIFGDWSQCLAGEWGGAIELLPDPYTYAGQGMIAVHAYAMADVAVRHPESFSKSDAVLTS